MRNERDTTRIVRSWLGEGVTTLPDRVLDAVLDQLPATPQRGAGWLARRFPPMSIALRLGIAAAIIVLAAVIGFSYLDNNIGSNQPEPTATPEASARPLPTNQGAVLSSGTYFLTSFPVHLTVEVPAYEAPAEWFAACSDGGVLEQSVCFRLTPASSVAAIGFPLVDNVVADPCSGELLDPPVGPTVDDLVNAIGSLEGFEMTDTQDITIDGFHGARFTLTRVSPEVPDCGLTWASGTRLNGMGSGEANLVRILDVDGVRIVLTGAYDPAAPEAELAVIQQLFSSVQIER